MTDPISITGALASLKAALDIAKGLRTADVSLDRADLKLRIADLTEALVEARSALLDAGEEMRALREDLVQARVAAALRSSLTRRGNVYVSNEDPERALCPRCFDKDRLVMALSAQFGIHKKMGNYQCPQCKTYYF